MNIEETLYNLQPIANNLGGFQIKDYDNVRSIVANFIEERLHKELVVIDKESLRVLKDSRTDIRKQKEMLKQVRLQCVAVLTADLENQFKELEKDLDNADKDLKTRVDEYEEINGKAKAPQKITLTVKGYDMAKLKLVQEFAKGAGLEATIKE